MSCYEWEAGKITLPRAAVVPVRRAIIARNNQIADDALALAKKVWAEATAKQKRDAEHLRTQLLKQGGTRRRASQFSYLAAHTPPPDDDYDETVETERAERILGIEYWNNIPRPPQKKNAGHAGATETGFHVGGLSVSFDAKSGKMAWGIGENNHAVEHGRNTWLAQTVMDQLDKVRWTRGTGGWFTGNDEYNRDDRGEGSGGNYVTSAFGPAGMDNHPGKTAPFTKSDGTRVTREMLSDAQGKLWAREAREQARLARALAAGARGKTTAKSTAGSFAPQYRSAPEVRL